MDRRSHSRMGIWRRGRLSRQTVNSRNSLAEAAYV
jgi:hypothetical protein